MLGHKESLPQTGQTSGTRERGRKREELRQRGREGEREERRREGGKEREYERMNELGKGWERKIAEQARRHSS